MLDTSFDGRIDNEFAEVNFCGAVRLIARLRKRQRDALRRPVLFDLGLGNVRQEQKSCEVNSRSIRQRGEQPRNFTVEAI